MIIHTKSKCDEFLKAFQNIVINPFCFTFKKNGYTMFMHNIPIGFNFSSLFSTYMNKEDESLELYVQIDEDGNLINITLDNMFIEKGLVSIRIRIAGLDKSLQLLGRNLQLDGTPLFILHALFSILEDFEISFSSNLISESDHNAIPS